MQHGTESRELTPFIKIDTDNTITLMIHKQEMGQGVRTALAVVLAEELDVELSRITIFSPSIHLSKYGRMDTGGSGSIRRSYNILREAGAAARDMLITTASLRWQVKKESCAVINGTVVHANSNRRLTYGELCLDAALLPIPTSPELKSSDEFKLIGKTHLGIDTRDIVTGRMEYGIDACPDDTLHATIIRCPAAVGTLKDFDVSRIAPMAGFVKVKAIEPDWRINGNRAGLGIIAHTYAASIALRKRVKVSWNLPEYKTNGIDELYNYMSSKLDDKAIVVNENGTPDEIIGTKQIRSRYFTPPQYQAHIEPLVCVAEVKDGGCTIWVGHQFPQTVTKRIAEYLNISESKVLIHPYRMGGAFGRKYENDFVMEAVQLANGLNKPVKVLWSREDDMQFGFYQTPSVHEISCAIDEEHKPVSWIHKSVTVPYDRPTEQPVDAGDAHGCQEYVIWDITHFRTLTNAVAIDINRGAHRSIGNVSAQFAIGSFKDEVAHAAGSNDSIAYYLKQLGKDRILPRGRYSDWIAGDMMYDIARLRACIERVKAISQWSSKTELNVGMGFSAFRSQLTYCATVVRVESQDDYIRVSHIWNVTDCGQIIDFNGAQKQVVGALVFGLSCALNEKIYSEDHNVMQSNFHQYSVARMRDIPKIEHEFMLNDKFPTGLGEPAVSGVAPALGNAIFQATGKRIRSLPFSDHFQFA